jgi:tetratricopeptide (TPR) repeat protein
MSNRSISWLFFLLFLLPFGNKAQDIEPLLKDARQFEASFKDEAALQKYLQAVKIQPGNLTVLCKISELYNLAGKDQSAKDKQKQDYLNAKTYAQKALQVNANNAEANVMMSAAMGRMALIASGKDKINAVKDIKSYAEKAIRLDPNGFKAYHVLGKWHYEVSDLSGIEKWLVKIVYGGLPPASYDDALRYYEKCRQLNPNFVLNYLEMAKVYHRKDNDKKAIELLQIMLKLPDNTSNDAAAKEEAKELMEDWK